MKLLLILTVFIYSVNAQHIASDLEPLTDEIVKAINNLGTTWKAGENFGGSISVDKLFSDQKEADHKELPQITHSLKPENLPNSFDARTVWPECPSIGKIYDQRKGAPAWIYASVGQIADRLCIKYGVQIDVETTVERMIRANGGFNGTYNSADFAQAFNYWSKNGIYTVKSVDQMNCLPFSQCRTKEIQFDKYFKVYAVNPRYLCDKMRDVMVNGPLTIRLNVYTDLPSYKSGIYRRTSYQPLGAQVIKLIGWSIEKDNTYWLFTNSWGTEWGINGVGKLHLGSDQFGSDTYAVSASFQTTERTSSTFQEDQLFELY